MWTASEKAFFLEHGYLHARGVLDSTLLASTRAAFDSVWESEKPKVNQHRLLKHEHFIRLIEHPPILKRQAAMFGRQTQLLQFDLLRQDGTSTQPQRGWHRDFVHPGDVPIAINTILYLDDMTEARGPTRVVPGSHRGADEPPRDRLNQPLDGEVAVYADTGDAVFINSAIWHSGGRNQTDGLRRGIYLYYGYWWLKRYDSDQALPWQALENASELRLHLLGLKRPGRDFHMYDPSEAL